MITVSFSVGFNRTSISEKRIEGREQPKQILLMNPLIGSTKVVLAGDHSVGKTAILQRLIDHKFTDGAQPTICTQLYSHKMTATNGHEVSLQIWDTAGEEQFHSTTKIYFRDSQAAIIVYDASIPNSIERIIYWINLYQEIVHDGFIVIAGNKSDQLTDLAEAKAQCLNIENQLHVSVSLVSALNGDGIDSLFQYVADNICTKVPAAAHHLTEETDKNCFC